MPGPITNNAKIVTFGDIAAGFEIVDRVGMSVELVAHLFGANKRPTGERGLLAWWRTWSGVVNGNAHLPAQPLWTSEPEGGTLTGRSWGGQAVAIGDRPGRSWYLSGTHCGVNDRRSPLHC